jgi:hypothetical protein
MKIANVISGVKGKDQGMSEGLISKKTDHIYNISD